MPARTPTVSILIPNFNHAGFLQVSLSGACGQTLPALEILVLDDGSTDNSLEIIEDFRSRHPQVRLLRNEINRGLQYSINRLLSEARGEFVVSAAADDQLLPQFLEKSVAALSRHPEAAICFSEFVVKQPGGEIVNYSRTAPDTFGFVNLPEYVSPADLKERLRAAYVWLSSNTAVISRRALQDAGGFLSQLEWHSDWFAFYSIALRRGFCLVPEGLSVIRANPGGYSDSGMKDPRKQQQVLRALIALLKSEGCRDLLPVFRRRPSLLSVFGYEMLHVLMKSPRHWDLLVPYLVWGAGFYRRRHRLSWPALALELLGRGWARALRLPGGRARPRDTTPH
jgi:glycosyltransferase involved in cell wall biosynthesis